MNFVYLFPIFFLLSVILIVSSESPYFSIVGVIVYSILASFMMFLWGYSLLGWVFLIVYVGGMVVVFSFTASMSSSVFPKVGGLFFTVFFFLGLVVLSFYTYLSKWWAFGEVFSFAHPSMFLWERFSHGFYLAYNTNALLLVLVISLISSMICVYMSCLCYSKGQILRY
uniref:NADH-ubiquinone oxidoreductase chain 6 n=1 Tax=Xenoturbella japonica TaxID=1975665 RepID=A0A2Z5WL91_9BILA|nr:NADH dehydrogenase subunit 6 [Xenoturbella japonica]